MKFIKLSKMKRGARPPRAQFFAPSRKTPSAPNPLDHSENSVRHKSRTRGASGNARGGRAPLFFVLLASLMFPTGCRGAPSVNVLGSFFPAWMLCIALGVIGVMVARRIFIRLEVEPHLKPRPLIYFCLWMLISVASWLLFFRS